MALDLVFGRRGGKWDRHGDVGVEEVHGGLSGGTEVGVVRKNEVQVGFQGLLYRWLMVVSSSMSFS